jgi:hypothetical protein
MSSKKIILYIENGKLNFINDKLTDLEFLAIISFMRYHVSIFDNEISNYEFDYEEISKNAS